MEAGLELMSLAMRGLQVPKARVEEIALHLRLVHQGAPGEGVSGLAR